MRKLNHVRDIMLGLLAVIVATVVVFGQVAGFKFVNWDDDLHVVQNRAVTDPGSVSLADHLMTPYLGYPVPVTVGSYVADHFVAGLNPAWYHTVNLMIHVIIGIILYILALNLGCRVWVAAGVALLFAVHPAVGEPVSWVSGRKDLLAAMFSVMALASFLGIPARDRGIRARLPAAGLCLLAALSKPSALLVPVLLLVLDLRRPVRPGDAPLEVRESHWAWRKGAGLSLWAFIIGINAALAVIAHRLETGMGALQGSRGSDLVERVLAGAGWHARIVFWPFDLLPKYLDPAAGPSMPTLAIGGLVVVGMLALVVWTGIRRHPAFVGLALAVAAYIPQSGVVPLSRQYANSYIYLVLAGLALAAGAAVSPLLSRTARPVRMMAGVAAVILVVALGLAAHSQGAVYRDGVKLWSHVWQAYPDSPQVCRNLGNAYIYGDVDQPEKAVEVFQGCIVSLGNRPFFLKNLAVATYRAGHRQQARQLFLELRQTRPGDPVADKYLRLLSE
ncbi:MAG TPA: hypothetical protein PLB35_09360 [Myxococcota bacterium]|nr:hypothetical protein [Myxococcota bacterium]HOH77450.1 hypothetical protein [Myxococcota bacterium]